MGNITQVEIVREGTSRDNTCRQANATFVTKIIMSILCVFTDGDKSEPARGVPASSP